MKFKFFGAEPILIEKVIFYREVRGLGGYSYKPSELAQVISGYQIQNDYGALDQILKELFWLCNQGRRPCSLETEQSFLALAAAGYDLLAHLRPVGKVPNTTYSFIDPLHIAFRLEREAEQMEGQVDERWERTLWIYGHLASIYIAVFSCWVSDFPELAVLPTAESMKYLLETADDNDFAVLLTAFAETEDPKAKHLLVEFSRDDEDSVRALAKKLLAVHPGCSRLRPN